MSPSSHLAYSIFMARCIIGYEADSMTDVNLSMEQWWMTPDPSTNAAVAELTTRCRRRRVLQVCNPVTNALLQTTDLAAAAHNWAVALRFEYNDAGPDVSAVYTVGNRQFFAPYLHLSKWPEFEGDNRPFSQHLKHGEMDCLTFPLLFPPMNHGYHPGLMLSNVKSTKCMTRAQWVRYVIFNQPPHIRYKKHKT
jgi:hypothetical protein